MSDRVHSKTKLAALAASQLFARISPSRFVGFGAPFSGPDRLLITPKPILPGDAAVGAALYGGTFALAGATVEAGGNSIFEVPEPSAVWARELHGFSWLSDLAAADTLLARAYARALIEQWAVCGRKNSAARRPDVAARRLLNWLSYAPFVLGGADRAFRRRFLRGLARNAARLRRESLHAPAGATRVLCAIALTQAGLCLPDSSRLLVTGSARLSDELREFVLPDGGVASRNPRDLLKLLFDLMPLAASFSERGLEAPREMSGALDRMLPMLRFFRHGDSTLALFNGMGATDISAVDALVALDDAQGRPVLNASFSGYQRMENGKGMIVITDAGPPPPLPLSEQAHAGTLSFELSSGASRIVVNCGAPDGSHAERRMAARKTAAHSTVSVGGSSSSRFVTSGLLSDMLGPLLRDGPQSVHCSRDDRPEGSLLTASHDGYAARFGMIHERALKLVPHAFRLDGTDVLRPTRQKTQADISLAFHLHPDVRAVPVQEGRGVLLTLINGETWLFSAEGFAAAIEESIFFAGSGGPRRSEQILVRLGRKAGARVAWSFARTGDGVAAGLS